MITASGCCFLALDTGRIMLQQRSEEVTHPLTWSFWGGKSENTERPIETLLRECKEEMGPLPDIEKVYPIHTFISDDSNFTYHTFCITVFEEFIPLCNKESAGYAWIKLGAWPKPLHRGAKLVLDKPEMVDKIKAIYDRQKGKLDLPNWLDTF
jgi:8-oxo-dGTP pyrophosphatase MutT (NUDIX family)